MLIFMSECQTVGPRNRSIFNTEFRINPRKYKIRYGQKVWRTNVKVIPSSGVTLRYRYCTYELFLLLAICKKN
jgi:hypothetical protein